MSTLYAFGDSTTYGNELEDITKSWPYCLGKKLNLNVVNLAYPGGSNWRIVRELYRINPQPNDFVVIGWTLSSRFEFGRNLDSDLFYNEKFLMKERVEDYYGDDVFINNRNSKTQSFFPQIISWTWDSRIQTFAEIAYDELYNEEWFDDMFRILYWAARSFLARKNTKWLMFDTWCPSLLKCFDDNAIDSFWYDEIVHKNYNYFGKNHMNNNIKLIEESCHVNSKDGYWNELGHEKVANLLLNEYEKNYAWLF